MTTESRRLYWTPPPPSAHPSSVVKTLERGARVWKIARKVLFRSYSLSSGVGYALPLKECTILSHRREFPEEFVAWGKMARTTGRCSCSTRTDPLRRQPSTTLFGVCPDRLRRVSSPRESRGGVHTPVVCSGVESTRGRRCILSLSTFEPPEFRRGRVSRL